MIEPQNIVACCFDLRGYRLLLAQDEGQLARVLQIFVAFVGQALERIPGLAQLSLQGDAIIAVYQVTNEESVPRIVTQLGTIISKQAELTAQLQAQNLPAIRFGLGIDWGRALKTTTYIEAPQGDLYIGKVISTAIRFSDFAEREPDFYPIIVSDAVQQTLRMQPQKTVVEPKKYHCYASNSFTEL